jgi:hypothetical protein
MTRLLLLTALLLASCSRPREGFVVVDPWGSIVLKTDDEEEAWRLAAQLTSMGRVLASKPQYFVLKGAPATKASSE